ncbi:MAG: cupin domain-containing protein [Deltaproteobacteria bacterium]|jgi:4-carboxymuconolactone decarboxylase|nr:cupin domain-containing protein [Deltaproteobacteria bacterium]
MTPDEFSQTAVFPIGEPNTAYAMYFTKQSYLHILTTQGLASYHVTFEPGCRNFWHIHHGGGQILLVTAGSGYYQEFGQKARALKKGDVVNIGPDVKHWHGASLESWFSHIAIEIPASNASNEWLEEVTDEVYLLAKG